MDLPTRTAMGQALRTLALKEMDPSLLTFAILRESAEQGVDVATLTEAMELAAYLHRDDVRSVRGQMPVDAYVTHPFRLVLRLLRYGCRDGAVLCAAALHDTVEDHPTDLVALLDGPPSDPARPTHVRRRRARRRRLPRPTHVRRRQARRRRQRRPSRTGPSRRSPRRSAPTWHGSSGP